MVRISFKEITDFGSYRFLKNFRNLWLEFSFSEITDFEFRFSEITDFEITDFGSFRFFEKLQEFVVRISFKEITDFGSFRFSKNFRNLCINL